MDYKHHKLTRKALVKKYLLAAARHAEDGQTMERTRAEREASRLAVALCRNFLRDLGVNPLVDQKEFARLTT